MGSMLVNWKTTAAGVAAFGAALGDIAHQASTGNWDPGRLWSDAGVISAGVGFLFAKDHNVTGGTVKQ
jgi:hypothetical protein